jgi:acyl-coenzyme A thioesterase PaaI-like protein
MADVPFDDGNCFACGPTNPVGMHVHFERDGETARARVTLGANFQGWRGIVHGGIAMALIDEAMAHAAGFAGHRGVTAAVNVRFRGSIPVGEAVDVTGRIAWQRRHVLGVQAEVRALDGTLLVEGEGSFVSRGPLDAAADRRNPAART